MKDKMKMKTQIVEEQEILTEFKIKSEEKDKISNKLYNFYRISFY